MAVSVQVTGAKEIKLRYQKLPRSVIRQVDAEIGRLLVAMDSNVKQTIQTGGRSGRVYKRRTVTHRASAPGEPPKTDTGKLVAGFVFKTKRTINGVVGDLMNKTNYAKYVEYKPKSRGGRPFMRPLFNKFLPRIRKQIDAAIKRGIRNG